MAEDYNDLYNEARQNGSYGNFEAAAGNYERAADVAAREFGPEDERLLDSLSRLGYCRYRLGELVKAEQSYKEALTLIERFHNDAYPDRLASILWALAVLMSDAQRYTEAEQYYKRSMAVSETWAGPTDRFVADCLWGLSKCLTNSGRGLEAESAIKRAISIYESLPDDCRDYLATNHANLGALIFKRNDYEGALHHLVRAFALRADLNGADLAEASDDVRKYASASFERYYDDATFALVEKIVFVCLKQHKYSLAEKYLHQSLSAAYRLFGYDDMQTLAILLESAACYNSQNKYEKTVAILQKPLSILRQVPLERDFSPPALRVAVAFEMSLALIALKRKKEAKEHLNWLLKVHRDDRLSLDNIYAESNMRLGLILEEECQYKKARKHFEDALFSRQKIYGPEHKMVAEAMLNLARCFEYMRLHDEASRLSQKAGQMIRDLRNRA